MVSLSRSLNTNSGGATFFSESVNMDDREYLQPILESYGTFKPLKTILPFSIHLIVLLSLEVAAIVFAVKRPEEEHQCREYFILLYAHVAVWFITLIVDQMVRSKHYNLRMNGYLEFYKKTQAFHQLPIYVVSLWNTTILLIQAIMQHVYPDDFAERCVTGDVLSPITYLCALITVEFLVISGIVIQYIVRVRKFNSQKPPPDVQKEEWNACSSAENFAQGEVGYRQLGDKVYDFIEKQADLIRHLKDHNARLGEKLMVLNAQLQARGRTPADSN